MYSCQKPEIRVKERNERALKAWREITVPRLKKWAHKRGFYLGFHEESGISDRPTVRRTWGIKGRAPIIRSTGSWAAMSLSATIMCTPKGNRPRLLLKSLPHSVKWPDVIAYVKDLKRHHRNKKLLLFWDGLAAHKAKAAAAYLRTQRNWLRVERLPAYCPEINPAEYLWSAMKHKYICNLPPEGKQQLKRHITKSYRKIRNNVELLKGFLKVSGLFTYHDIQVN